MASYQGSSSDQARAHELSKKREEMQLKLAAAKNKIADPTNIKTSTNFTQVKITAQEEHFKQSTYGLQSYEEYKAKREQMERLQREADVAAEKQKQKDKKRKRKQREKGMQALSFGGDEEDENLGDVPPPLLHNKKKQKRSKDPTVDTTFLPDKEREAAETALKESLAQQWDAEQAKLKAEPLEVTYSYWDGSGHRFNIRVTKGTTIGEFLEQARASISSSFNELRFLTGTDLVYVKEDTIIPHDYSFYDLIISKARGKTGPLFYFDVHDDIGITKDGKQNDAHAGKICTRTYVDRNAHVYPVVAWENFNPSIHCPEEALKPPSSSSTKK